MAISHSYETIATELSSNAAKAVRPVTIVWCVAAAILTVGVACRWYNTFRRQSQARSENRTTELIQDVILTLVLLLMIAEVALGFMLLRQLGEGFKHSSDIVKLFVTFITCLKTGFILFMVNITCLWLSKTPLFVIYLQLAIKGVVPRGLGIAIFAGAAYHLLTFFLVFLLTMFGCGPDVSVNWQIATCSGIIGNPQTITFLIGSVSTDIILMILGVLTLSVLHKASTYHRRELVAIALVFCIGFTSLGASVVRFVILWSATKEPSPTVITQAIRWYSIESIAAVVACNLPSFRNQLRMLRHSWTEKELRRRGDAENVPARAAKEGSEMVVAVWEA